MIELLIVIIAVAADQYTKHLVDIRLMPLGTSHPFWENIVHFTSAHNTGAVFGILEGWRYVFLVLTVVAIAVMLYVLVKKREQLHLLLRICLALIIAGAIGNFIDRLTLGYVRDMIELRFINFAIFNVADCCVTIGASLLMYDMMFGKAKYLFEDNVQQKAQADTESGENEPVKESMTGECADTDKGGSEQEEGDA